MANPDTTSDEGKLISVELNELEQYFCSMSELPVGTTTWFRGDYRKAVPSLEHLTNLTINKNVWLTGRVRKRLGKMALEYRERAAYKLSDFFLVLDPDQSPLSRETPLSKLGKVCYSKLPMLSNGEEEPLFRVLVVPCQSNPQERFAIIVIVSHLIADGATYYRIHEMICSNDESLVQPLIVERIASSDQQQQEAMGLEEWKYMSSAGLYWNWQLGLFRANRLAASNPEEYFALVDPSKMELAKEEALVPQETNDEVSFVSTNDVLTSWFLQHTGCSHGQLCLNFRGRLPGHGPDHSGNYENVLFYRREDSTTPVQIRQSLPRMKRESHQQPMPGFFERATSSIAILTNWASFGKPCFVEGAQEDLHVPIYDVEGFLPHTYALLIVFRAGPQGTGLFYSGRKEFMDGLHSSASFLSNQNLE